jgi:hypothetical protein
VPTDPDPPARSALALLAAVQLGLGAWMVLSPATFYGVVAPFGPRNDHGLRDMASWELALGVLALTAVSRPGWRAPVVALALVHYVLHAVNHLVDVGEADPGWVGPMDLLLLASGAGVLAWLLVRTGRRAAA